MCGVQWTAVGRRGRRGRRAALTATHIDDPSYSPVGANACVLVCGVQWTVAGRRGPRGRRAARSVDITGAGRATVPLRSTAVATASVPTS